MLLLCSTGNAAEFAVVELDSRTTTGTQDFTSTGFGTPVAVLCMASRAATNGTAVNGAGFSVGASDGTRQWFASYRSETASNPTATGRRAGTVAILQLSTSGGITMEVAFSAWITDGVRLNYVTAPGSSVKVACTLIGGAGIAQAYVGTAASPGTVDTGTDVTAPNFQPDVVIGAVSDTSTFVNTNTAQGILSLGYAVRSASGNPHPQRCISILDVNAVTPSQLATYVSGNRIGRAPNTGFTMLEVQDFDAQGFTLMTRTFSQALTMGYLALRLTGGLVASVDTLISGDATGVQTFPGLGLTPQFALLGLSANTAVDTNEPDDNGEVFGAAMVTTGAQYVASTWSNDAAAASSTESFIDAKPLALRRNGALFARATFSSFGAGSMLLNFDSAPASRTWIGLFIGSPAGRMRPVIAIP